MGRGVLALLLVLSVQDVVVRRHRADRRAGGIQQEVPRHAGGAAEARQTGGHGSRRQGQVADGGAVLVLRQRVLEACRVERRHRRLMVGGAAGERLLEGGGGGGHVGVALREERVAYHVGEVPQGKSGLRVLGNWRQVLGNRRPGRNVGGG